MSKLCPQCGAPVDEGAVKCEWCGAAIASDAGTDSGTATGTATGTDAEASVGKTCPQCGAPVDEGLVKCEWCGAKITADVGAPVDTPFTPVDTSSLASSLDAITPNNGSSYSSGHTSDSSAYSTPNYSSTPNNNVDVSLPLKSKVVAGVLAILLGGLGIHKFYLGQIGKGVLYILFCWTYIPAIIALIEGIMILCKSDADFEAKYNCRTK